MTSRRQRQAAPPRRPSWVLLLLLALGSNAVRVPSADTIGVDLLVRVADTCDVEAAWRLLNLTSFSPSWLAQAGSSGETALTAAVQGGCGELVALIMLHPNFDDALVRRSKLRKAMVEKAVDSGIHLHREFEAAWAISVMVCVRNSKVAQDELREDPGLADMEMWFLPSPGEWFAPQGLKEMGLELPMDPPLAEPVLDDVLSDEYKGVMHNIGPTSVRREVVERLWYLMVARIQSPEGSERRALVERHIRSIGWSLFFGASKNALHSHALVIELLASFVHRIPVAGGVEEHIPGTEESAAMKEYRQMAKTMKGLWNRTGNWWVS
mmetsp:Transcript_129020/g.361009  ORF Transcript_129020/g.361009 Transcript_129020/m.361009 type:complete len:324 (+) Transcript_129020:41-1012(+)